MELSVGPSSCNCRKDGQDTPVRAHCHCERFHSMSHLIGPVVVLGESSNILYSVSDEAAAI